MQAWLGKPGFLGTHGTFGADLSFMLALVFTLLFLWGWVLARKGKGSHHHTVTLWAMVAMLVYFSGYYLARNLGVLALEGKEGFGGSEELYHNVFLPILTVHITVVALGLIMAIYMIILGFRAATTVEGERVLSDVQLTLTWGGVLKIVLWALGILALIFVLIRLGKGEFTLSWGLVIVYIVGLIIVLVVLMLEKVIERIWPDGSRRHRMLGRFTMTLFVIALITSTATYVMLYILYPAKTV
ncbi:MAG TPA: DUF420 domain-containing protein [Nitrospirales bacterium]|nr:DUF420 domain-containing protein [Nitrospirales bacterium]HIA14228.1 DUF420 domain-containing protein [Nitrospirales bacterium]HIB54646.1 DUF420 domain-containing protein [Nitrospirales bacterium]HIC04052.1 DUF420 domain-containing protein [Nitrospirales bacterium]HIN33443.1 DUF420 domain-containing protein [Nitrospirales bacterium]